MAQTKKKTGRHHSAIKAARQSERRNLRNRLAKKAIRLSLKDALELAQKKDAPKAQDSLSKTSSLLDKAARKGFIHWKAVARKKSYLARRVSSSLTSTETKPATAAA